MFQKTTEDFQVWKSFSTYAGDFFFRVFFLVILFIPAVCPLSNASDRDYSWRTRGIGGGGALYSVSMSPHDENEVYIATDMSAVFKTGDFGASWHTIHFSIIRGGPDSHIRFTSDPDILYAIDRSDDMRTPAKSLDGGKTFSPIPDEPAYGDAYSLFADPDSTSRILLSDYNNLYFSGNGGGSFTNVYAGSSLHIGGVFWDSTAIYAGTSAGLIASFDNGVTFDLLSRTGIPATEKMVSFAGGKSNDKVRLFCITLNSGDVYPGVTGAEFSSFKGIYRLDSGETAWTKTVNGLSSNAAPFFVGMSDNNMNIAYVAGGTTDSSVPVVYKTTDGGDTWSDVFKTSNNTNIHTGMYGYQGDADWWYPEYALGFGISPINPDRVVLTDLGTAHTTDDGGVTWHQAYCSKADENIMGAPTPKGKAYHGNGLEDTSAWWLFWENRQHLLACFTDIRGIFSADSGKSWQSGISFGLPHNTTYHMVREPASNHLFGATATVHDLYESTYLRDSAIDSGDGHIIRSTDGGLTWELYHDFNHPVVWLAAKQDTLYASVVHSQYGGIYVNPTAGSNPANWTRLAAPPRTEGHPFNIRLLDDGAIVVTYSGRRKSDGSFTESSGVFYSTDNGLNWFDRSHSGMMRWTKDCIIDPHDPEQNTWYVAVFSHWGSNPNEVGGVYMTTDRGVNWERISDSYRVESMTIHPVKSNIMFFTTETEGLWITRNLGDTSPIFSQVQEYPFCHPVRVFFNPFDHNEIWATSFGNGLRVYKAIPPLSINLLLLN